jgi:hypothetical protein
VHVFLAPRKKKTLSSRIINSECNTTLAAKAHRKYCYRARQLRRRRVAIKTGLFSLIELALVEEPMGEAPNAASLREKTGDASRSVQNSTDYPPPTSPQQFLENSYIDTTNHKPLATAEEQWLLI